MLNLSSRKKVQEYHRTHRHTWIVKNLALFAILSQTKHTQKHRTPKFTLKIVSQPVLEVRCQCLSYVSFLRLCQMVYSIILYGVSFLSHKYRMLAYVYCHLPSSKCWRLFFYQNVSFFRVCGYLFFSLFLFLLHGIMCCLIAQCWSICLCIKKNLQCKQTTVHRQSVREKDVN